MVHNILYNHVKKWKKALSKEENSSTKIVDLSKTFDTINHDLLLANLRAYGPSKQALSPMCSQLKNSHQMDQLYIQQLERSDSWGPKSSFDGPFFNLFINDLFLFLHFSTSCNYAEDNNLFPTGTDVKLLVLPIGKDPHDEDACYYDYLTLINSNE